jgi:hypothetical protein
MTDNTDTMSRDFHHFVKLPVEIQCQIWEDVDEPRALNIRAQSQTLPHDIEPLATLYKVPISLQVHIRSRTAAKFRYQHIDFNGRIKYPVYLNPRIDTLLFDSDGRHICHFLPDEPEYPSDSSIHQVRFIAVGDFLDSSIGKLLILFPILERITTVNKTQGISVNKLALIKLMQRDWNTNDW